VDTIPKHFGLVVAYLLPGFIGLAGVVPLSSMVAEWLRPVEGGEWGLGPTVYVLMTAITVGMIISCFRWVIIDHMLRWTGVVAPRWDFRLLATRVGALDYLVDGHYRYYQFYANTLMAVLWAYPIHRFFGTSQFLSLGTDLGALILCAVLFAGARDTLANYYLRAGQLIGPVTEKDPTGDVMTNGIGHHEECGRPASKPSLESKPQPKAAGKPEEKSGGKSTK
jgi:hypothetical protein